jgi:hypothetical protein
MRKQRIVLEHHADPAAVGGDMLDTRTIETDFAPGRAQKARDDLEHRGLAAAGRSEQRDQLSGGDRKMDLVQRDRRAEDVADALQIQRLSAHVTQRQLHPWCGPARNGPASVVPVRPASQAIGIVAVMFRRQKLAPI